jgi:hypothetical protein
MKERFERPAKTTRDLLRHLQSASDRARQRTANHEGGHTDYPTIVFDPRMDKFFGEKPREPLDEGKFGSDGNSS